MKLKHLILTFIIATLICTTYGCKKKNSIERGNAKVTYELVGGTYRSSNFAFHHYYKVSDDEEILIKDPTSMSSVTPSKEGYTFGGWYKKITEGKIPNDADKWDFTKDKITSSGVTLYAYWKENVVYSYDIYWINENGEEELLTEYIVNPQSELSDDIDGVTNKTGYTFLRYLDENKNEMPSDFKHPGGDTLKVKVYAEFLKGKYTIVKNAKQLSNALVLRGNIYLANDIDLEGATLYLNNYKSHFMGNGHTISNVTMTTSQKNIKDSLVNNILYVSLFGNIENATIENVNFENVTLSLQAGLSQITEIIIAPIATIMTKSTISNVTFSGTFEITEWPKDFNIDEQSTIVEDAPYYEKDETSQIINTIIKFKNKAEDNENEN